MPKRQLCKTFLFIEPNASKVVPPELTAANLIASTDVREMSLVFVLTNLWFHFGEKIRDVFLYCGCSFPGKFKISFREFGIFQQTEIKSFGEMALVVMRFFFSFSIKIANVILRGYFYLLGIEIGNARYMLDN